MKEFNVNFDKICLDVDRSSVQMIVKDFEEEEIVLHFSKSDRVTLLHQMQNNLYNTRQEYKQFTRHLKQEEQAREAQLRTQINQAVSEDIKKEMQKELQRLQEKKKIEEARH